MQFKCIASFWGYQVKSLDKGVAKKSLALNAKHYCSLSATNSRKHIYYLPKQNVLNIVSIMSSLAVLPVIANFSIDIIYSISNFAVSK